MTQKRAVALLQKVSVDLLAPIFTQIFQKKSLEWSVVLSCFKAPSLSQLQISGTTVLELDNDDRPVAPTSLVMKGFDWLVASLKDITGPLLDPLQFTYRSHRAVQDAVKMGLHFILGHLNSPGTHAQILCGLQLSI